MMCKILSFYAQCIRTEVIRMRQWCLGTERDALIQAFSAFVPWILSLSTHHIARFRVSFIVINYHVQRSAPDPDQFRLAIPVQIHPLERKILVHRIIAQLRIARVVANGFLSVQILHNAPFDSRILGYRIRFDHFL